MTTATVAQPSGNQYGVLLAIFLVISFATVVVYWNHERRMDRIEDAVYEHAEQLAGLWHHVTSLEDFFGVDVNEPVADDSPGHEETSELADHLEPDADATSALAASDYPTDEIPVAPPTVPDGMPLAVQTALIERPSPVPRELMTPETAEKQRAARAAWVEEQLARFSFTGGRK